MDKISEIEKIIGYSFKDKDLLATAFTHSSYAYQYKTKSNENLEFLGDSILNFIVAELLYLSSIGDEGQMTEVRAAVVSRDPLAAVIRKSGLKAYIRYGTGCESQYHSVKFDSNLFEAILGAIYIDGGMDNAKHFVYNNLGKSISYADKYDYKSRLQEYKQANCNEAELKYVTHAHGSGFMSTVYIGDDRLGGGSGRKKKEAEREAAKMALNSLGVLINY